MGYIEVHASINREPRGFPMHSVIGADEEKTALAADLVFLKELVRQSTIFNRSFERAWARAIDPSTSMQDLEVLSDIQSALFASIIVRRILSPEGVMKHPQHGSRRQSQEYADARASRLTKLLEVAEDSPILAVAGVRNSYEHIDERIDVLTAGEAASITDWAISDGLGLSTIRGEPGVHHRLRVFYPAGGVLFYDDQLIDLYHLDIEMLALRMIAQPVIGHLADSAFRETWRFGRSHAVYLIPPEAMPDRYEKWVEARSGLGEPFKTSVPLHIPTT